MAYNIKFFFAIAWVLILLAACGGGKSEPVQAVEKYLNALASKDVDTMLSISCADWESSARLEFESFSAVTPELVNLQCTNSSSTENETLVSCSGILKLDYGGEVQEIDLSGQIFRTEREAGEWLVCGYK